MFNQSYAHPIIYHMLNLLQLAYKETIIMGKKGKKSKSGGKVIVESSHITVPTNETKNNSNSGLVDEDELAYIQKDKRTQICKDISNNEPLLLPNKPDLTIDPRTMHQRRGVSRAFTSCRCELSGRGLQRAS